MRSIPNERLPVVILGGGLAGLTAAQSLRKQGVPFLLYEASKQLGGMGRSFTDADGFSYDFGAHFITNRLAAAVGIGDRCRVVRRYGEAVRTGGRTYGYPFGLLAEPRFALSATRRRLGVGTYVVTERHSYSPHVFAVPGQQALRHARAPQGGHRSVTDLRIDPAEWAYYDYVLVQTSRAHPVVPGLEQRATLLGSAYRFQLYRIRKPALQ